MLRLLPLAVVAAANEAAAPSAPASAPAVAENGSPNDQPGKDIPDVPKEGWNPRLPANPIHAVGRAPPLPDAPIIKAGL